MGDCGDDGPVVRLREGDRVVVADRTTGCRDIDLFVAKGDRMDGERPKASVVIPTLNGGSLIAKCLAMIYKQATNWKFEVIVIDSGSTDATVDVASRFPVRLHQISQRDFNHGSTRQWGVELARGEYVAFLSQDAVPYNDEWLRSMVEVLESDPEVAGVYSRQVPLSGCDPIARARVASWIAGRTVPVTAHVQCRRTYESLSPWERRKFINFDNVSSCVRRCVMQEFPFAKVRFAEDTEWSKRVLEVGHKIRFEPRSMVYHSHGSSVVGNYRRAYIDHKTMKERLGVDFYSQEFDSSKQALWAAMRGQIRADFRTVLKSEVRGLRKLGWLMAVIPLEVAGKVGCLRGAAAAQCAAVSSDRRRRIVLVTHDFPPDAYGGVAVYTYELAKALSRTNDVRVFYRRCSKTDPEFERRTEVHDELVVTSVNHNFAERPDFLMTYANRRIDRAFRQFLAETIPDIVHFQFLGGGLSTGMVAAAQEHGIPTVLTLNDYWFMCPRGQMVNYRWELCSDVVESTCARCVVGAHAPVSALARSAPAVGSIDLLGAEGVGALAGADTRTIDPTFVGVRQFTINKVTKPVLLAHPPTTVRYRVGLPKKSSLAFSLCMHPASWQHREGEGVRFEVVVHHNDNDQEPIFARYIDPKHEVDDRRWHDCRVDLSAFGDRTVDLILSTAPGPKGDHSYCTAGWGEPRIEVEEAGNTDYGVLDAAKVRGPRGRLRKAAKNAWALMKGKAPAIRKIRARSQYMLDMLDGVDVLVAPSTFLRDQYVKFGISPERIHVSDYGMNSTVVWKTKRPLSRRLVFGYTGTLMETKGVHVLIEAFRDVREDQGELRIYGYAPNEFHREYVQLLRDRSGDRNNIRLMGKYEPGAVGRVLSGIDVLVVPSIWWENSPLTIHEAFMAGVPVIASNIGGMAELVKHLVSGLLFEARNPKDLYAKIMLLIEQPELVGKLSAATPAVKSIGANVRELVNIYDDLIDHARAH